MSEVISRESSLIAVSEQMPVIKFTTDAEVDIEILKAIPKQFAITDEKTANWLVKRVVAARDYAERVKKWAEQEVRRADREEHTLMFLFGRQTEAWVRSEIEKLNGRRKSVALPAGTVGVRATNACLQIDNEQVVLIWAKRNCPSAVVVVEKLSRSILKEYFEKTGEVPDAGAHVEPAAERFYIR